MRTSFISTVFNEEKTIIKLLDSLLIQSRIPDEIIIVDGGSTDNTLSVISSFKSQISGKKIKFKIIQKKGNRSVGRNEAIRNTKGNIILCSDAGCVLDKNWVKNITKPFINSKCEVVAGYYKAKVTNVFEKCVVPYVLVMPDQVDPKNFLPATRSIAFKKEVWKKIGGFDKKFSHNEDYVFARKIKQHGFNIVFAKDAIAYWISRSSVIDAFVMFFRFALGDSEAEIYRPKVLFLFARYGIILILIFFGVLLKINNLIFLSIFLGVLYVLWSIIKNYKYVMDIRAIVILPVLQIISDIAVLLGTVIGIVSTLKASK